MTFRELKVGDFFIDCGEVCVKIEPEDGRGAFCTVSAQVYRTKETFAVECEDEEVVVIKRRAKKAPKTYKIEKTGKNDRVTEVEGDLDYLKEYFGYVLEVGHSHDRTVNKNAKTIKSFVNNLQKAYSVQEAACYDRTGISLVS